MAQIHLLSSDTINKIAAGEVIENPAAVVKELVENSIDAKASAITVEVKGGGIDLIRVTDNGCGIEASQIPAAFMRHATSKINDADDLLSLHSLGFRGEALSSIASVSDVEMITKTSDALSASLAVHDLDSPSSEFAISEIGAPDGTTVIVRNLFGNVPVRKKFLKSKKTETGKITDLISSFALSRPDISFHYRLDGKENLHTSGNGDVKELIYRIYGKDQLRLVIPMDVQEDDLSIRGFLGRPETSRTTRSMEQFFVNGRMLKSDLLSRALEEGYRTDLMQHQFPFAILYLTLPSDKVDVNIHPSKREGRFVEGNEIYILISESVRKTLRGEELIPQETLDTKKEQEEKYRLQEQERQEEQQLAVHEEPFERAVKNKAGFTAHPGKESGQDSVESVESVEKETIANSRQDHSDFTFIDKTKPVQRNLFDEPSVVAHATQESSLQDSREDNTEPSTIFTQKNAPWFQIVGQIFGTYWIIEVKDTMLIIDQHAAHEKVNFENMMKRMMDQTKNPQQASQMLSPSIIVNLSGQEEAAYEEYQDYFRQMGYDIEPFGEQTYAIRGVPVELYGNEPGRLFSEILDEIVDSKLHGTPDSILSQIASMSCKASVKGSSRLSMEEAQDLIRELLKLNDPYHCPHGRPTMIRIEKEELDRKFKRIV